MYNQQLGTALKDNNTDQKRIVTVPSPPPFLVNSKHQKNNKYI